MSDNHWKRRDAAGGDVSVAIDLGASNGRIAVGALHGNRLEFEIVRRFPTSAVPVPDGLQWDIAGFWREIRAGLRLAGAGRSLASVGVDSWAADFGLLSERGELLGGVRHYRDPRMDGMMEEAWRVVPKEDLYRRSGLQFAPFNTLYQLMAVQRFTPELLEAARTLLFVPDLVNYWLCGVASTERTIASTSQLLDPHDGTWMEALARTFDLNPEILPTVVRPGTRLAPVRPEVATEIGGHRPVVVAPAEHDTASAVAAVPADEGTRWGYISSGTWSLVGLEIPDPVIDEAGFEANLTNEGGVHGTTRLIKNVTGLWLLQECRRGWNADDLDRLLWEAADEPAFASLIDPNNPMFFAAGTDMPERIATFCRRSGQVVPTTPASVTRCILESLALAYAAAFETLEGLVGDTLEVVHVVGGGARNGVLCQWAADATGKVVVAGPYEATLIGNLLIQFEALGHLPPEQRRGVVRRSVALRRYEPHRHDAWQAVRDRFQGLSAA